MKVIIIGHGATGWTCASTLRLWNRSAEITVVDSKSYDVYHPCAMPYAIGGLFPNEEPLMEKVNYSVMNINFLRFHRALKIHRDSKVLLVEDMNSQKTKELPYDYLILTTGSRAWVPPIKGSNASNIYTLKWIEDAKVIREAAENASKVVVVGASAIGLEVGTELAHRGLEVVILELMPKILPRAMDPDFADTITEELLSSFDNLKILTDVKTEEIVSDTEGRATKILTDKGEFEADFVVMATGVRPNIDLAKDANLEIGKFGAIVVDDKMFTNDSHILAAGDCAQAKDMVTGQPTVSLLASYAVRMARIAAMTLAKPDTLLDIGTLNNFIVPFHTLRIGSVGLNSNDAKERGYSVVSGKVKTHNKPAYMPDAKELTLKILVDKNTKLLLGAQAIGPDSITDNLNIVSLAIQNKMTVIDLLNADLCYAPAVNETIYPITQALEMAARKLLR